MAGNSAYVSTTSLFSSERLYSVDVQSAEFKELLVELWRTVNNIALVANMKDTGYYPLNEFVNSQFFFPDPAVAALPNTEVNFRPIYRTVINFGALPNTAAKTVAHNLTFTDNYRFTRIYGCASDPTAVRNYIPLPFASPVLANNIALQVDDTNVTVTTGSDRTAFTTCYIVLEYLKH